MAVVAEPPVFLFDLFGTLIPGGTREQRDAVARMVAGDLEVDPEKFAALIRDTFDERTRGLLGDLHSTLKNLAARLGEEPSSAAIERGVRRRLAMNRSLLHASWALPDLDALRAHGSLIGVVSDCSAETPAVWADSPLAGRVDATAFSCVVGVRKPAAAIYLTATAALGVDSNVCIFVGDGASTELSGARALGMRAIWFDDGGDDGSDRPDAEIEWSGERIMHLSELHHI